MVKRGLNKDDLRPINEIDDEEENEEIKENLVDAYNNPLAINMGLGPLPLTTSIYKDKKNEDNSNTNLNLNE